MMDPGAVGRTLWDARPCTPGPRCGGRDVALRTRRWAILGRMSIPVATVFPDWPQHARRIRDAIAALDAERLAIRAGPEHAPIWALDTSFEVVRDVLARWAVTAERRWGDTIQVRTRASVLNRLFSHDAFHAGGISQLLRLHDAGSIDLWRRTPPAT